MARVFESTDYTDYTQFFGGMARDYLTQRRRDAEVFWRLPVLPILRALRVWHGHLARGHGRPARAAIPAGPVVPGAMVKLPIP